MKKVDSLKQTKIIKEQVGEVKYILTLLGDGNLSMDCKHRRTDWEDKGND